jgi:hypothetical protein
MDFEVFMAGCAIVAGFWVMAEMVRMIWKGPKR